MPALVNPSACECVNTKPFLLVQISFSRGKKRYMFDFRFELKWEAPDLDCGPAKGLLMYPDVGQDCDGEYDVVCQVRHGMDALHLFQRCLSPLNWNGVHALVHYIVQAFL